MKDMIRNTDSGELILISGLMIILKVRARPILADRTVAGFQINHQVEIAHFAVVNCKSLYS